MTPEGGRLMPLNILLVDDNELDVEIALKAFGRADVKNHMYVVNDGQEALDFVLHEGKYLDSGKHPRPDLILLDIRMPRLSGHEVLQKFKSNKESEAIPVVILTSSDHEKDIEMSYRMGAAGFMQKPLSYEAFVRLVEGFNHYWHRMIKLPNRK